MKVDTDQNIGLSDTEQSDVATALYRHLDRDGRLLYVGISLDALHRLSEHMGDSSWKNDIAMVVIAWFKSRREALEAERIAISTERPAHNKHHNRPEKGVRAAKIEDNECRPVIILKDRPLNQISKRVIGRVVGVIDRSGAEGMSRKDVRSAMFGYLTKNETKMIVDHLINDGLALEVVSTTSRGGRPGRRLFLKSNTETGVGAPINANEVRTEMAA